MNGLIDKIRHGGTSFWRRQQVTDDAPELVEPIRNPYGAFRFVIKVAKGTAFEIHASTNLKVWRTIAQDTAAGEEVEFVDPEASKFSFRFYRVLAGTMFSTSVIGYASTTLPPGCSMIANPFEAASNDVANLLKGMPEGTRLNKFDAQVYQLKENHFRDGKWSNPHEKLVPGEGALLHNPTSDYRSLNFVGEIIPGKLTLPIPQGFSVRSSLVPVPGRLDTDLGFPVGEGDSIHLFDRDKQDYVVYDYDPAKWEENPPLISVGESFWVAKAAPGNWSQTAALFS
jgi:hypothetical protein